MTNQTPFMDFSHRYLLPTSFGPRVDFSHRDSGGELGHTIHKKGAGETNETIFWGRPVDLQATAIIKQPPTGV